MRSTSAGRGLVAGDDRGGIARGDVEKTEDEQSHHQHDGYRGEDAADDVGQHQKARAPPWTRKRAVGPFDPTNGWVDGRGRLAWQPS